MMDKFTYLQYGCAWCAPSGWRNFDASPTLRFERIPLIGQLYTKNRDRFPENVEYGDIAKGLPLSPESCNGVYCSHVLEHLSLHDFRVALANTYKILKFGGLFRFVLPDLEFLAKEYINNPSENAALEFMRSSCLGYEKRPKALKEFIVSWLGNSHHLWMWDFKSIKKELSEAGFVDVRRAYFGDSFDSKFQEAENKDRWENCLGVECKKV
jgi:SAM-dependent methyltransferase